MFLKQINRIFLPLLKPRGFTEVTLDNKTSSYDFVAYYVLKAIVVEIYVQPRGGEFEVGVNFGHIKDGYFGEKYSFHTLLALVNVPLYYEFGFSIAKSNSQVIQLLEMYENALKQYGENVFNDNDDLFRKIRDAVRTGKGLCPPYYMQPENKKIISKFV